MLVSTYDRAIGKVEVPISDSSLLGQNQNHFKDVLPYPFTSLSIEMGAYSPPVPVIFGKISPWTTHSKDKEDTFNNRFVWIVWPSRLRLLRRKQRFELVPLLVGQSLAWYIHNETSVQTGAF